MFDLEFLETDYYAFFWRHDSIITKEIWRIEIRIRWRCDNLPVRGSFENSTAVLLPNGAESVTLDRLVRMEDNFHTIAGRIECQRRVSTADFSKILPHSYGRFILCVCHPVEHLHQTKYSKDKIFDYLEFATRHISTGFASINCFISFHAGQR